MLKRMPARHAGVGLIAGCDRALDCENVLAVVFLDRLLEMRFERLSAACTEHMAVLERNAAQHEIGCERRTRADERLIAARALVAVQPDDDRQRLCFGGLDDLRQHIRAQSHERRERHAALQEIAAAHPLCEICLPQALPLTHIKPPNQYTGIPQDVFIEINTHFYKYELYAISNQK